MTADVFPARDPITADDAPPLPMMVVNRVQDMSAPTFKVHAEVPCAECGQVCGLGEGAHRRFLEGEAIPTCRQCAEAHFRGHPQA
jgi:hypothetical protein